MKMNFNNTIVCALASLVRALAMELLRPAVYQLGGRGTDVGRHLSGVSGVGCQGLQGILWYRYQSHRGILF